MNAVEQLAEPVPEPTGLQEREADDEPLPDDEVFHLLQCRRRRDALRYLHTNEGGPVRMRDLAEQVAAWEHETTVTALSSKERQRVYIPLYQTHLPKLDESDVIEYDQQRGQVARGPLADQLAPYLQLDGTGEVDERSAAYQTHATPRSNTAVPADAAGQIDVAGRTDATGRTGATERMGKAGRTGAVGQTGAAGRTGEVDETTGTPAAGRRWSRYYLGALGLSGLLLAGAALDIPPVGALHWVVVATLIALLFAALSVGDLLATGGSSPNE